MSSWLQLAQPSVMLHFFNLHSGAPLLGFRCCHAVQQTSACACRGQAGMPFTAQQMFMPAAQSAMAAAQVCNNICARMPRGMGLFLHPPRCNITSEPAIRRPHAAPACANFQAATAQGMIYTQALPMFMQPGLHHATRVGQPVFMQPAQPNAPGQTPPAPRHAFFAVACPQPFRQGHTCIRLSAAIQMHYRHADVPPLCVGTQIRWSRRALWSLIMQLRCQTDLRCVDGWLV